MADARCFPIAYARGMKTLKPLPLIAAGIAGAALFATPVPAQPSGQPGPPYTVVETGKSYSRLQDAVDAIGGGSGTIRFASMRFADCAVQTAGTIAYIAAVPGEAVLDGVPCEGKAALVLRGRGARIEGMVFSNIRVPDKNGAGIRLEKGNLDITQSWFRDSEQGILTAEDSGGVITIDKSTFTRLGTCEGGGGCAHSIYVGGAEALNVTRTRFEAGRGGHYLKSRATRVSVTDTSFDDTAGKATNYMIDLPAGSVGKIAGNWFVQGKDKENHSAFIAVGAENILHTSNGLRIEGNNARFAPGVEWPSVFVADWSDDKVVLGANTLGPKIKKYERR